MQTPRHSIVKRDEWKGAEEEQLETSSNLGREKFFGNSKTRWYFELVANERDEKKEGDCEKRKKGERVTERQKTFFIIRR